jgi:dUTP pyrophosphatase
MIDIIISSLIIGAVVGVFTMCLLSVSKERERPHNEIRVVLDKGAYAPESAHDADAGYDLRTPKDVTIHAGGCATIDTGVHIEIPKGYVGFLKSKSGLNVKSYLTGEGVIDSGYTGSIVVRLYHNIPDGEDKHFKKGDKIIQIVLLPIFKPDIKVVDKLETTERGDGGFGSTGR